MFSRINRVQFGKALPVQVSHRFGSESAVFDDDNLVSCAGLVPVMRLAEQTGLGQLLADKVHIKVARIKSGAANPAPKLATLVAGMCAGADCIDDIDVIRSGGPGYRFHEWITVHDRESNSETCGNRAAIDSDERTASRRKWILDELRSGRQLRAPEIAAQLKCSSRTIKRDLDALKTAGQIVFVGPSRAGHYELAEGTKAAATQTGRSSS